MNLGSLEGSSPDVLPWASEFSWYLVPTSCLKSLKTDPTLLPKTSSPASFSFCTIAPPASLSASHSASFSVAHPLNVGVFQGSIPSNLLFNISIISG